jgi:CheY-like chemotaxis protein
MKARNEIQLLVIEDNEEIRESVGELLEAEDYQVTLANDGLQALAMLANGGRKLPDLVVLDLMMPVMSGQKFLEALQEDKALRKIPVIVMTASGVQPESPSIVANLKKPFAFQDLLDLITYQLTHSK